MNLADLDTLIPQYAENKTEMDSYKKICDKENATIKSIMIDFAVQHYEAGGYRAVRSTQERETMNEEMLIDILKNSCMATCCEYGVIKTKEYIDFDALEKAIYDNAFSNDQVLEMNKAREIKYVTTLRVSKIKDKKEER